MDAGQVVTEPEPTVTPIADNAPKPSAAAQEEVKAATESEDVILLQEKKKELQGVATEINTLLDKINDNMAEIKATNDTIPKNLLGRLQSKKIEKRS